MNDLQEILKQVREVFIKNIDSNYDDFPILKSEINKLITEAKYFSKGKKCVHCDKLDFNTLKLPTNTKPITPYIEVVRNSVLIFSLKTYKYMFCDKCISDFNVLERIEEKKKLDVIKEQERKSLYRAIREDRSNNREKALIYFVNTKGGSGGDFSPSECFTQACKYMISHPDKAKEIKNLPYKEFLNHWYWWTISNYVKHKSDNKCKLCNSDKSLNVHHKTYSIRGEEYKGYNWKDSLICLCQPCHKKQHGIE